MKTALWLSVLVLAAPVVSAQSHFTCGTAKVDIELLPGLPLDTSLTVQREGRVTVLHFNNIDFIGGTCLNSARGEPRVVFQAVCGGSGCHDLENWGVIDPVTLKVLLIPDDDNTRRATQLLGVTPVPIAAKEMLSISREVERLGIPDPP